MSESKLAVFDIVSGANKTSLPPISDYPPAPSIPELLAARRFDLAHPPVKPVPVLSIGTNVIATPGNLIVIAGQPKAGKTALVTGILAALMGSQGDCLGMIGSNPEGLPVIHFDTEQARYDHDTTIRLALKRAGLAEEPSWFESYTVVDLDVEELWEALRYKMTVTAVERKLGAVILDGTGDFCFDPNDAQESFRRVGDLHRLALAFHCPLICLLHENPGTNHNGKTRGHLGSQLERKAETNLRVVKDANNVTTIFTERSRHCHIPKAMGPRFKWDEKEGMHLSQLPAAATKKRKAAEEEQLLVDHAFAKTPQLRSVALAESIMTVRQVKKRQAQNVIKELVADKLVRKNEHGLYEKIY